MYDLVLKVADKIVLLYNFVVDLEDGLNLFLNMANSKNLVYEPVTCRLGASSTSAPCQPASSLLTGRAWMLAGFYKQNLFV